MSQIWKYRIDVKPFEQSMPAGARIIAVQTQGGWPHFWALVDPEAPKVARLFAIVATGQPFDAAGAAHHGTFQMNNGDLVFHLFEFCERRVTP